MRKGCEGSEGRYHIEPQPSGSNDLKESGQDRDGTGFPASIEGDMQRMYRVALRITRNREDAEDAVQQGLLNAFVHRDQFQGKSAYSTWLTRIAINEALGCVRRARTDRLRRVPEASADGGADALDMLSAGEDSCPDRVMTKGLRRRVLDEAIGTLQGGSRAVVWLLGIHERPIKEAAQALNISESAVKARFHRARRQLRECIEGRV